MKKPNPETNLPLPENEMPYPTEREMLLKDETWILLEIKLLKEELAAQRADLKRIMAELAKHQKMKLVFKK